MEVPASSVSNSGSRIWVYRVSRVVARHCADIDQWPETEAVYALDADRS
jgi:hypothetical protein